MSDPQWQDPRTPDEWHGSVVMARACLALHTAITCGLINANADGINVSRCREIVDTGVREHGVQVSEEEVDAAILCLPGLAT